MALRSTLSRTKRQLVASLFSSNAIKKGIFSLERPTSSQDFPKFAQESVDKCKAILKCVDQNQLPPSISLELLDSVSNIICSVIDVAELTRNVHESPKFREASEEVFSYMLSYINELNRDSSVYYKLKKIVNDESIVRDFTSEEIILAKDLLREFEANGVHLANVDKEKLSSLQEAVGLAETSYSQGEISNSNFFAFGPIADESLYNQLERWLSHYIPKNLNKSSVPKNFLVCSSRKAISDPVMHSVSDENIRRSIYKQSHQQPSKNAAHLGELISSRSKLARFMGFQCYSEKYLSSNVLKTPQNVSNFLAQTKQAVQPLVEKEIEALKKWRKDHGKIISSFDNNPASLVSDSEIRLPWNLSYWLSRHRLLNSSGQTMALSKISSYFPLRHSIENLKALTMELFNIEFVEEEFDHSSESWMETKDSLFSFSSPKLSSRGLYKLHAYESVGLSRRSLGIVYLDLFQRPNKFVGAGHFVARCGCRNSIDHITQGLSTSKFRLVDEEDYQEPVVALVLNLSPSQTDDEKCLTCNELETLYHEWGHALHSLLSKTKFQHLSGTRGAVDYSEVPSHLFEYFSRDPVRLASWGKHVRTGEKLSEQLARDATASKEAFLGIEVERQLLYSEVDQFIFGTSFGDICDIEEPNQVFDRALAGALNIQRSYGSFYSPVDFTQLSREDRLSFLHISLLSHTHFVNYGGGYYSYLFARMYAAQLWSNLFEKSANLRESGELLRREMLVKGASEEPKEILQRLSGGPLDIAHYINSN